MTPLLPATVVALYFALLLGIAFYTSRHSDNESFFIGNRNSKWWLVAFGMVGTSLSGITFISVPGTVGKSGFDYLQVVGGYVAGYMVVAFVLLPLYYRLQLTSIYSYLGSRFGMSAYKTGALFFIVSRTLGATLRLYLVIKVLERFVLAGSGISFEVTAVVILVLILLYTYRGGVKTIVWTDTLQTTFMLTALLVCLYCLLQAVHMPFSAALRQMAAAGFTHTIRSDPFAANYFWKQFIGGAFITIAMTGLDQEMMQKNISVRTLGGAQKNVVVLSLLQAGAVVVFLLLGGMLYLYVMQAGGSFAPAPGGGNAFMYQGKAIAGDDLFPTVALSMLPPYVGILFIIGLISALFPSADGALTALTSSFCIDLLGIRRRSPALDEARQKRIRLAVHYSFAALFLLCVFFFKIVDDGSVLQTLLVVAGYTYGPLLALFAFGMYTRRTLRGPAVPIVCIAAPALCYILKQHDAAWLGGWHIGTELLLVNAVVTFGLLWMVSKRRLNAVM